MAGRGVQDVGDHDAAAAEAARQVEQRMARRRERQARVGLLRNTNQPPPPPMRRPPLIGRRLSLRSSRRPKPAAEPESAPPSATPDIASDLPLIESQAGRISGVDIDRLARLAETLAAAPHARPSYAEQILGGGPAPHPPERGQDPRAAQPGGDGPDPAATPPSDPVAPADGADGWRGILARWMGRG